MSDVITVFDVGAFEGFSGIWDELGPNVELIGVDPFEEAGLRYGKFNRKEITFREVVGDEDRENVDFYLSRNNHASSLFKQNVKLASRFHNFWDGEIIGIEKLHVKNTIEMLHVHNITKFDFLKIDLEGAELMVMKNLEKILKDSCVGIFAECFFQEYHHNRPLFSEVELYVRGLGYHVFDIQLEKWGRKTNPQPFPVDSKGNVRPGNAQVMFANVLFLKDPILDENTLSLEQIRKLVTLANLFNQKDFADELQAHFNL